jgi:CheY-like chemotaxis protein
MANGPSVSNAMANVVVVAADAERLGEYEAALRRAKVPTRVTLDADEAETFVSGASPDVLVLDRGLPRMVLFRLYGLVREDANEPPVQVVFVGQEGETGPGDHYLPGDPSPSNVAERVTELLASVNAEPSAAHANDVGAERGAASAIASSHPAPPEAPPARPATPAAAEGATTESASVPDTAVGAAATSTAAASANGVSTDAVTADAPADAATAEADEDEAPKKSGRRLDVILIRIGLVLLILGALLLLIQSDAFPPALVAPRSAPATPTQRPTASPKPGAFLDGAGLTVPAVAAFRQG